MSSYLYALGANISFAGASHVYAEYSKKISVIWMNSVKAILSLLALAVSLTIMGGWTIPLDGAPIYFVLSGAVGLGLGDLFLLKAFTVLGPGRTLMTFGFQPLFLSLYSFVFFDQLLNAEQFFALVLLLGCLLTFSYESFKVDKHWNLKGTVYALIGVLLDTTGIILSREAFDFSEITAIQGHFCRCVGAVSFFILFAVLVRPIHLKAKARLLNQRQITKIVLASLAGTYLSLLLYLKAIEVGELAIVSSIAITGPFFASVIECVLHKRWPSRFLLLSFVLFVSGYFILIF